jgi:hypothetical protein
MLYAGPSSSMLSQEQNDSARKQALLQAGLMALLSSSGQPGGPTPHLFQILAQSALAGQAGGANARQQMVQQNRAAQLQQLMQSQGGVTREMLDQMTMQALGAGDMEAAGRLIELRKVMRDPTANQIPRQYRDEQGNLRLGIFNPETRSFEPIEGASPVTSTPTTIREYRDPQTGESFAGRFDPATNRIVRVEGGVPVDRSQLVPIRDPDTGELSFGQFNPRTGNVEPITAGVSPASIGEKATQARAFLEIVPDQIAFVDQFEGAPGRIESIIAQELKPADIQQLQVAGSALAEAWLRMTTGAAYNETEFENARRMFIPMPGDSAAVLAMKSENRQRLLRMLRVVGGARAPEQQRGKDGRSLEEIIPGG